VFLLNSRLGLFSAALSRGHPFSLSYGVFLPSSLTRGLPLVFGFSPRLPVSVCGTGTSSLDSSFSCQCEFDGFPTCFSVLLTARDSGRWCFTHLPPSLLERVFSTYSLHLSSCVTASLVTGFGGIGFLTDCPSPTAFALGLGPDLP
jgi:hypothetical protein